MNQKIARLEREIAQAERKLAEVKGRLKGLREDRDKLVDDEIVRRVRRASKSGVGIEELLGMLEGDDARKRGAAPKPPADTAGEEVKR